MTRAMTTETAKGRYLMNLSQVLLALLYFSKNEWPNEELTWKHVGKALIRADYDRVHEKLSAVLNLVIPAYVEALSHPELGVPYRQSALANVFIAPFSSHFSLEFPNWNMTIQKEYPLEAVYNAMFKQIMSDLMLTTVKDCPQYLEYADNVKKNNVQVAST